MLQPTIEFTLRHTIVESAPARRATTRTYDARTLLSPLECLVLSILQDGPLGGLDILRTIATTKQLGLFTAPFRPAELHPALSSLMQTGLIEKVPSRDLYPSGVRVDYALTPVGHQALRLHRQ